MDSGQDLANPRRRILKEVVCALLVEAGFDSAADECIETLLELMTSLLIEMGTTTRNYCELAGRTQPVIGDFVVGLVSMGVVFKDLEKYAVRENRPLVRGLSPSRPPNPLVILQAGNKPNPPTHIIPSHLPPLPDPHAYIRTATYKQPVTEYEAIREKAATQKRDIDRALTKFLAKTSETQSLFDDEENQMYPSSSLKLPVRRFFKLLADGSREPVRTGYKAPLFTMPSKPISLIIEPILREPGSVSFSWLEIQRTKASLIQQLDLQTNFKANETLMEFGLYPKDGDCEHKCPELDACIASNLWCDGYENCPSGYDESSSECGATRKLLELPASLFAALGCIAAGISACLIFCMIGLVRRRKKTPEPKHAPAPTTLNGTYTLPKINGDTYKKESLFYSHDS